MARAAQTGGGVADEGAVSLGGGSVKRIAGARIAEHPILEGYGKGPEVKFTYDGRDVMGYEGEPIAAALKALGVMTHRYTVKSHEPRGIFCAIGRCTDCVMVVDGAPNVRTCMTPLRPGMDVRTQHGLRAEATDTAEATGTTDAAEGMNTARATEADSDEMKMMKTATEAGSDETI
jgi:hypothetical protein